MNGLEAILDMIVKVVLQVIVAFARIIDSLADTETGKQMGLDTNNYAGAPTGPTPPLTVEMLQAAGIDTVLKFIIPAILIYVFVFRARGIKLPMKGGR